MPRLLLLILTFTCLLCKAQPFDESGFIRYTTIDGLSNNYVTDIVQDSKGFIWIATKQGLNRFDGTHFKNYFKDSRHNAIPDNSIYSMQLFGDRIALATDDGAHVISTQNMKSINLTIPGPEQMRYWSNASLYVRPDIKGNYAVSTKTGFYVFSEDGKIKNRYDHYAEKDIGQTWMLFGNRLFPMPDGKILQWNNTGLLIYDGEANRIIRDSVQFTKGLKTILNTWKKQKNIFFTVTQSEYLIVDFETNSFDLINIETGASKSFNTCINLKDEIGWQTKLNFLYNNLWAINSRDKGFFLLEIDTLKKSVHCSPVKYFSSHSCKAIFADREKRLWIGTDKGLYMQRSKPQIINSYAVIGEGEKALNITSLFISNERIFLGTSDRKIIVLDKHTKEIIDRIILPHPHPAINIVNQIVPMGKDTVWLTVNNQIWSLNTKNLKHKQIIFDQIDDSTNYLSFLYRDRAGVIWIHSNKINTVFRYNPLNGGFKLITQKDYPKLKVNVLNAIAEDKQGNIWMSGDALARWNRNTEDVDTLIENLPTQIGRKKGFMVMADEHNDIWALVNDDGFARLTPELVHIRPKNLLFNNTGNLLPTLLKNKLFVPTNEGVGYLDLENGRAILFTVKDGMPDEVISSTRIVSDPSNQSIWFACKNKVCNLSFSEENYSAKPPFLTISELSVINGNTFNYPARSITLTYNQNDIRLLFGGINFTDPENMRYAYRFITHEDSTWIEAGNQPNIILSNMGAGAYNLQVKVYAYDNKWPEQVEEIIITIKPPFWKSTWFILTALILLVGSAYFLYKRRIKGIQQKANLDNLLAQTEMKALHAQMNPHFIFNCLNSIREMILNNENRQASHYLSKFAQLIRITLDYSTKPFISLHNTIDYLNRYLEMEKIRTDHFSYEFEIDEALEPEDIFLPPMLIQPFIENAIWHGQQPGKQMHLNIRFLKENEHLICEVEDDGIGIETSLQHKNEMNHHSVGIANIKQRILLLNEKYKLKSTVHIEDKSTRSPGGCNGTKVTLRLPVKNTAS